MSGDRVSTFIIACCAAFLAAVALGVGGYAANRPMPKPVAPAPLPMMGVCVDPLPYESGITAVSSISAPVLSPGGVLMCPIGTFVPVRPS